MSKNYGWITLNRQITSHWIWTCEPYSKAQAWVDLLLHANHADTKITIKGVLIELKRGQQARSQVTLSEQWRWSRDKVKRYLKLLEEEGMISQQTSQLTSVISICNYNDYQDLKEKTSQHIEQQASQQTSQQAAIRQVTVNNDNNVDNEKTKIPYQLIADSYNQNFADKSGNSQIAKLTDARKRLIKKAWKYDCNNESERLRTDNLDYWNRYFSHCSTIKFFQADCQRSGDHANWKPDFDFIMTEKTQTKVREGKYQ